MNGIAVAGNMIVDIIYPVERYPASGELTTITGEGARSTGGAACNVLADLARLDPGLPLTALGVIGEDAEGEFIRSSLSAYPNVDFSAVARAGKTSFTAVMQDNKTRQRTFFQYRGANAQFCEAHIPWEKLQVSLLHIGYLLLLDALDQPDAEYGTKMARLLHDAQEHGIATSIDVVSDAGERFRAVVPPALRYTDYCVINELEAQQITGILLREENGRLLTENMESALRALQAMGVSQWAVIHMPEMSCGINCKDKSVCIGRSLALPDGFIKGTTGAGDAFCSGVLYEAYRGGSLPAALALGAACAACSLSEPGAAEGMRSLPEVLKLAESLGER